MQPTYMYKALNLDQARCVFHSKILNTLNVRPITIRSYPKHTRFGIYPSSLELPMLACMRVLLMQGAWTVHLIAFYIERDRVKLGQ